MSDKTIESILKELEGIKKQVNNLTIMINDRGMKEAELVVLSVYIRELLTRFNNQDVDLTVAKKGAGSSKKKSKRGKNAKNTIEELDYDSTRGRSYRYNVYVNMIKNTDDFAKKITFAWNKLDPVNISDDSESTDYIKFFTEYMAKKVDDDDITDPEIKKLRAELVAETKRIMKEEKSSSKDDENTEEEEKKKKTDKTDKTDKSNKKSKKSSKKEESDSDSESDSGTDSDSDSSEDEKSHKKK